MTAAGEELADPAAYDAEYFRHRLKNDPLRLRSFQKEKEFIRRHVPAETFLKGRVLDVGCSTGEFLESIGWDLAQAYGMEISEFAKQRAQAAGISFEKNIFSEQDFFDLVVFRGTIQYLPSPFEYLYAAYRSLKPGGSLFMLTPNTASLYYRNFKTLPYLEEALHFWIPCDASLAMVLRNAGFRNVTMAHPYLGSPYAKPLRDHVKFVLKLLFRTNHRFAFWRNVTYVIAQK